MENKKNTASLNLNGMSEKELKKAARELKKEAEEIQEKLDQIEKERAEKRRIKAEYALVHYEPEYELNYYRLRNSIKKVVDQDGVIDKANIDEIYKKALDRLPVKKEEIYPCPECGKIGSLYVGEFGDPYMCDNKKKIICQHCGFTCPGQYESENYAAWEVFHNWLIKRGYLDASVPEP